MVSLSKPPMAETTGQMLDVLCIDDIAPARPKHVQGKQQGLRLD